MTKHVLETHSQCGDGAGNPANGSIIGGGTTNTVPGSVKTIITERLAIATLKLSPQGQAFIKGWEDNVLK